MTSHLRQLRHRLARPLALTLSLAALAGCSTGRFSRNTDCALIGAGVGGAAGLIASAADNRDTGEVFASGAVGGLIGAAAGYTFCVITD
jgi:hypothetical protein